MTLDATWQITKTTLINMSNCINYCCIGLYSTVNMFSYTAFRTLCWVWVGHQVLTIVRMNEVKGVRKINRWSIILHLLINIYFIDENQQKHTTIPCHTNVVSFVEFYISKIFYNDFFWQMGKCLAITNHMSHGCLASRRVLSIPWQITFPPQSLPHVMLSFIAWPH